MKEAHVLGFLFWAPFDLSNTQAGSLSLQLAESWLSSWGKGH